METTDATKSAQAQVALNEGLAKVLARAGLPEPDALERLSGGASMESWRFLAADQTFVLRRAPSPGMTLDFALEHSDEVRVIRAAIGAGVTAPEVIVELTPEDGIGTGYVMRALPGDADPGSILAHANPGVLIADFARELAAVHATDLATCPGLPIVEPAAGIADLLARFHAFGGDRPILALALAWLQRNAPSPIAPRCLHGDFRLGNVLVVNGRLTGVLDWELAHAGDPHDDLAYGCLTAWRFSRPDRPAFGLTSLDDWFAAYTNASGLNVDHTRFRFWLVFRTLSWAVGCMQMGSFWREGHDRSLERVVIGRRTAEPELDLLLLLENEAPAAERNRPLRSPASPGREPVGEPSGAEILTAVAEWLASDIKPLVAGRGRFNVAVARNALGIVGRELQQRPQAVDVALSKDILDHRVDLATPELLATLRRRALDKLAADSPKYPALAHARVLWKEPV